MYTIGYSSLCESMPSVAFRTQTIRDAAAAHPEVNLIVADNNLNDQQALANAASFAEKPIDLAIMFHINETIGPDFNRLFLPRRIPVIAVDIPIPLAIFFGANNHESGRMAGAALGEWARLHWGGYVDRLLVMTESRVITALRERVERMVKGLNDSLPFLISSTDTVYVDGGSSRANASERARQVLETWSDYRHIGVVCTNDDSALGVLDAARAMGIEDRIAVCGYGADEQARAEIMKPESRFVASADLHFEQYGPRLMELALRILRRERVPRENFIEPTVVVKP